MSTHPSIQMYKPLVSPFQVLRATARSDRVGADDFVFIWPGALSYARFLMVGIYVLKMVLLGDGLPQGLVTPNMRQDLERMARFIAVYYTPWFLQARLAASAPRLDVKLWQDMWSYEVRNIIRFICG